MCKSVFKQKNVKYDHSTYAISVFQYENQNYIVTQSYSEENILKIKGYPNQNHSENDFYRLRFGMDLYEIAEIVGGPLTRNYASNGIRMIYPIKDNQYAMVDFFDYCEHIFYSGYFWFFTQDGEIKIGDE